MTNKPCRAALLGAFCIASSLSAMAGQLIFNSDAVDPAPAAVVAALVKGFEAAHPDVKVKVNVFDQVGYRNSVRTFLAGDAPDVAAWLSGTRASVLAKEGLFENINDVWEKNGLNDKFKSVASYMTIDGKKWGVPWSYYQWGIYYRKDIFEKLKIAPPNTWAELLAASAKLKSNKITPFAIGTKAPWPAGAWFDYLDMRVNGYEFHMDLTAGKIPYTDKRVHAVFDRWDELTKPGYFLANHQSYQWQDAVTAFAKGDAAMYLMANFAVAKMKEGGLTDAQIGFLQFPEIVKGIPMAEDAPTESFFIPARAKNKTDARRFMAYLARPEVQSEMNALIGQLPIHRDAKMKMDVHQQAGFDMLSNAYALAQFYDRDVAPDMAKAGLDGFQQYMLKPADRDAVLNRLEIVRQRVYK